MVPPIQRLQVMPQSEAEGVRQRRSKADRREAVDRYKAFKGCFDCGEKDPICLDLDHDDPTQKCASVAEMISWGWFLERLEAEIQKCTVRCANCHRKRHRNEKHPLRAILTIEQGGFMAKPKTVHTA